jgi:hypothetical protein
MGARASLRNPVGWFYGLAALFLGIAAWNPTIPGGGGGRSRAVLLDRSASVTRAAGFRLADALRRATAGLASGDSFCIIEFAGRARLAHDWESFDESKLAQAAADLGRAEAPEPLETDPHAAFALAEGLLARRANPEIVIVGDGRATRGGGLPKEADGVPWGGVAAPGKLAPNRAVVSLVLPRSAPPAGSVAVRAEVACDEGAAAPRSIAITTKSGSQSSRVTAPLREVAPGRLFAEAAIATPPDADLEIEARIDAGDPFPEDDAARGAVRRRGVARVGIFGGTPAFLLGLRAIPTIALVELGSDANIPGDLDAVIVADRTRADLGAAFGSIEDWVRAGGGLLYLGARRAFALGGIEGTALADALPLLAGDPGEPTDEILILIDASGSMAGAKFAAAKEAARVLAARAPKAASVRGAFFQSQLSPPFDLRDPASRGRLDSMEARGETAEMRALEEAITNFPSRGAKPARRRIFLVSDGLERGGRAPLEDAKKTGGALAAANIECVAFAVGADADLEFLRALTLDGKNGRALRVEEAAALAAEVASELERGALAPGGTVAIQHPAGAPIRLVALPPVAGVARTKAREGALTLATVESGIPLFAWSASARVAAVGVSPGSELAPNYAGDADLWRSTVAALAPPDDAPSAALIGNRIEVDAPSAGDAGSLELVQGSERAILWRTGTQSFQGDLGPLREGWGRARAGARTLGPVFLARATPIEASPLLSAVPWPPLSRLAAPAGGSWRLPSCLASILCLLVGACVGWFPRKGA